MGRKHLITVAPGDPRDLTTLLTCRLSIEPAMAAEWISRGAVQVAGARATAKSPLVPGSKVVAREPPPAVKASFHVVLSDEDLLVVDKPAGMLAQPSPGESDSLETLVLRRHPEARLAHRLDRDTSGLMLFTVSSPAHAAMQQSLARGEVLREYLAICAGLFEGTRAITLRIAPDPEDRSRRRALPESASGGQAARTLLTVISNASRPGQPATRLRATLDTGRTHQIRVHLAAIGHPLLGDRLYRGPPAPRLLLHAVRLAFRHPRTGAPLDLAAVEPAAFRT